MSDHIHVGRMSGEMSNLVPEQVLDHLSGELVICSSAFLIMSWGGDHSKYCLFLDCMSELT